MQDSSYQMAFKSHFISDFLHQDVEINAIRKGDVSMNVKDPNLVSQKLGNVMESCSTWLIDNKLSLHFGKTECMIFGSKRKLKRVNSFSVRCGDHNLASQEKVKYLGLTLITFYLGKI